MSINSRKNEKKKDKQSKERDNRCVEKIIKLYCTVCQCNNDSRFLCAKQRLSNNNCPQFTDDELITVYLWGKEKQLPTRKAIYQYTKEVLNEWFPKLPSYQAFCRRLNRLADAFRVLAEIMSEMTMTKAVQTNAYVVDSCPIMLAKDSRSNQAKVWREYCSLTRNPIKNQWYHGVKLHVFGLLQPKALPIPCAMLISPANVCDLWAAQQAVRDCAPIRNGRLFADRAYIDADWHRLMREQYNIEVITPRKKKKFDTVVSYDSLSSFVSSVRQPIEPFFNWINVKTGIQNASLVRSAQGLLFHVFSALAFIALSLFFNY